MERSYERLTLLQKVLTKKKCILKNHNFKNKILSIYVVVRIIIIIIKILSQFIFLNYFGSFVNE